MVLAVGLLFLHNTLPHTHHSELDETLHSAEHQKANSLLDFLQLSFHIDLGGDHLENFEHANELDLSDAPSHFLLSYVVFSEKRTGNIKTIYPLFSEWFSPAHHFWHQTYFRGPPFV